MLAKRIIFDVVLFISVFIFPWYISFPLAFVGIFIFDNFYEFIITSSIVYSLFAIPGERLISSPIFFSLSVIFFYLSIQFIRGNIILIKNKR